MKRFTELVQSVSSSTRTNDKLAALQTYFSEADPQDSIWVLALFTGRRPKRSVNSTLLKFWCREITLLPEWLFEESYHTVGDLGETIALLLPERENEEEDIPLHNWMDQLIQLQPQPENEKKQFIISAWKKLSRDEKWVFNKLITGGFRIGVSSKLMINALAANYELPQAKVAHMISGLWDPSTITLDELMDESEQNTDQSRPYPFFLAYPVSEEPDVLGRPEEWQAEWKWDGIRGQLIRRNNEIFLWSRGEELVTEKFPELYQAGLTLPDNIALDGEILTFQEGKPMPFQTLQTRIGRKNVTKSILKSAPVAFYAYDIMEWEGEDIREWPLAERRTLLKNIVNNILEPALQLSPLINFLSWHELAEERKSSRERGSEGIMLKRINSPYRAGRKRGDWWKWKIDPLTIDAVMIYAQKGHGRRSNLYTDYTFAVKNGEDLVPFAKAYSGLTDKEIREVDAWVKRNSLEKFGPVRTVKTKQVFEIAFEGIAASKRHKSGVAVRFPRIHRWRHDKPVDEINTLQDLQIMLEKFG